MYALFKKLLKLFARKENSATKLYKGIVALDQKSLEIRTVVTRIMSLLNSVELADKIGTVRGTLHLTDWWDISVDARNGLGFVVTYHHLNVWRTKMGVFNSKTGYNQPESRHIAQIHAHLSQFVDGMMFYFPELAGNEGRLFPYLNPDAREF